MSCQENTLPERPRNDLQRATVGTWERARPGGIGPREWFDGGRSHYDVWPRASDLNLLDLKAVGAMSRSAGAPSS